MRITCVVWIFLIPIRATAYFIFPFQKYSCTLSLKQETQNNSHRTTIYVFLPKVASDESLVYFQLCFMPAFPNEIPDYFWKPEESHCYITKDANPANSRPTTIGRPIRLWHFPVTVAQTLIRHGNGFFEIEDFQYTNTYMFQLLSITIRKNILIAGQYVCHIFQLKLASSTSKSAENEIETLSLSPKLTITKEEKYCYILPAYDDDKSLIFEMHDHIRFICDLCWFEMWTPNFMVSFQFSQLFISIAVIL